jgi:hypothetical protein
LRRLAVASADLLDRRSAMHHVEMRPTPSRVSAGGRTGDPHPDSSPARTQGATARRSDWGRVSAAAHLKGEPPHTGIDIVGTRLISFGRDLGDVQREHGFREVTVSLTFKAPLFERFLAKVAYGIAITEVGLDKLDSVLVRDDILGRSDTLGMYVGTHGKSQLGKSVRGSPPGIFSGIWASNENLCLVRLELFSMSDSPEYIVAVGELSADV